MSYINEALRKAQKERDRSYEQFRDIIAPCSQGQDQPRKRRFTVVTAVALFVLIPAGFFLAVYVLERPISARQEAAVPVVAEAPATPEPLVSPADNEKARETVQSGLVQTTTTAKTKIPEETRKESQVPVTGKGTKTGNKARGTTASSGKEASIDAAALPRDAQEIYQEALYAQRNLDMQRAEALYKRTIELNPGHVRAMNNLGVIFMERKKWEEAIALFNKAIVRKKDYVDPYYNLSCLYARRNRINDSLFYMKAAAAINGSVIEWAKKDADMKNVVASREFKKMMEEQKN